MEKSLLFRIYFVLKKNGPNSIFSYGMLKSCTYISTEDFQDKGSIGLRGEIVLRMQCHMISYLSYTTENAQKSKPMLQNCKDVFVLEKQASLQ